MKTPRLTLAAAGVFCFALALYGNTLFHGYVLDDEPSITKNAFVQRGFGGIGKILTTELGAGAGERHYAYRPVALVGFAVEKALFGNRPAVGHGLNILLYAGACAFLYLLLTKLLVGVPPAATLLATLLFVAHPTHAEVVANVKSRDEILSLLFLTGMLWTLRRYAAGEGARHLAWSLTLYGLALLTKEHAITFLAVVPLVLYTFTSLPLMAVARTSGAFALVAAPYLLLRKAVVGALLMPADFGGMTNVLLLADTLPEAVGTRLMIFWTYLRLLVFPYRLSWDYSFNVVPITTLSDGRVLAAGIVLLAMAAAGLWGLRKRSPAGFGLLFFLITFSVVSNFFILLRWTAAERFLFTPSLGICIACSLGLNAALERLFSSPRGRTAVVVSLLSAVVLVLSIRTFTRNSDWRSELELYRRDAATYPEGARLHYALANAHRNRASRAAAPAERRQSLEMAREEYRRSTEIYPTFPPAHEGLAYVHYALGEYAAAERAGRRAVELAPVSAEATHLLAAASFSLGRYEEAAALFARTRLLSPGYPGVDENLATTYVALGRYPEAIAALEQAVRRQPGRPELQRRLGELYRKTGDAENARAAAQRAAQLPAGVSP